MTVEEFKQLKVRDLVIVSGAPCSIYSVEAIVQEQHNRSPHTILLRSPGCQELAVSEQGARDISKWIPAVLEEGEMPT